MAMNVNNSSKNTWVKVVIVKELLHASHLSSNETWRSHTQPHSDSHNLMHLIVILGSDFRIYNTWKIKKLSIKKIRSIS